MTKIATQPTLGVIGVGSPEGARGRGRWAAAPDAIPGRLRTPIAASRQSVDSAVMARPKRRVVARGWQQPGGDERRSAMDGQPQDAGPENRQPFSSPCQAPIDDRLTSRTDGRETATMAGSSTSRGKGRLFTPFPAVSQLLPVLQIHFRSHADIYTHFIS